MTERKLGTLPEFKHYLVYDDETGDFRKVEGDLHWKETSGGFSELSAGDFWGVIRREDESKIYFRNERMYPDDRDRFLVFVNNGRQVSVSYADGVPDFSQLGLARVDIPNPVGRGLGIGGDADLRAASRVLWQEIEAGRVPRSLFSVDLSP